MTTIGAFVQAVPPGQDIQGAFGQNGAPDETPADSSHNGESFGAFLSHLSQPAEDGATPADAQASISGVQTLTAVTATGALAASRRTGQAAPTPTPTRPSAQTDAASTATQSGTLSEAPTADAVAQLADFLDGFAQNGGLATGGFARPGALADPTQSTGQEPIAGSEANQTKAPASFFAKGAAQPAGAVVQTAANASASNTTGTMLQGLLGQAGPQGRLQGGLSVPPAVGTAPTNQPMSQPTSAASFTAPPAGGLRASALAFLRVQADDARPSGSAVVRLALPRAQAGLAGGSSSASVSASTRAPQASPASVFANGAPIGDGASAPTPPVVGAPNPTALVQAALGRGIGGEAAVNAQAASTFGQPNGTPTNSPVSTSTRSARNDAIQSASSGTLRRSRGSADAAQDNTTTSAGSSAPSLPLVTPVITALANFAPAATFNGAPTPRPAATPGVAVPAGSIAMPGAVAPTAVDPTDIATAALAENATAPSIKVSVVGAATHFAPIARLSPTQQISDAITASAASLLGAQRGSTPAQSSDPTEAAAATVTPFDAAAAQPSAGSIKTLNLQLQPEALGQVTIKLNLSDSGLAVQVEAVRQQTAELIDKDKQSLAQSLSQSGYAVTNLEVTVTPQHGSHFSGDAPPQQGQADANAGQTQGQSTGFDSSPNGGRSAHDSSALDEPGSGSQNLASGDPGASRSNRRGGDLFI